MYICELLQIERPCKYISYHHYVYKDVRDTLQGNWWNEPRNIGFLWKKCYQMEAPKRIAYQQTTPPSENHRTIETGGKAVSSKTYKEAFKISADESSLRNAMSDKECQDT